MTPATHSGGRAASATIMPSTAAETAMPISTPGSGTPRMPSTPPTAITSGNTTGRMKIAGAPRNAPHSPTATIAATWSGPNNGCDSPPAKPPLTLPVWASAGDAARDAAAAIEKRSTTRIPVMRGFMSGHPRFLVAKQDVDGRDKPGHDVATLWRQQSGEMRMPVTITAIDTIQLSIPLDTWAPPPMFAGKPRTHVEAIYVRVTTSSGVVGWGESFGSSGTAGRSRRSTTGSARLAVGQDPTDTESDAAASSACCMASAAPAPVMHALSGLDIALWDIRGKLEGVSVSKLLGGAEAKARRDLRVAAAILRRRRAREAQHRARARARLQAHQAARAHRRSGRGVARGRRPRHPDHGRHQLRLDCRTEAEAPVAAMKPSNPFWVEEPIWPPEDFESLAKLRKATGVPLAMGENATSPSDFRKMIAAGATDFVQPSIVKIGGITQLFRDRDRIRKVRRHLRAACVLLRPGLSGDAALHRLQGARRAARAAVRRCRPGSPIRRPCRT